MNDIARLKTAEECGVSVKKLISVDELKELAHNGIVPHYILENPLTKTKTYLFKPSEVVEWITKNYVTYSPSNFVPRLEFYNVDTNQPLELIPTELIGLTNLRELPKGGLATTTGIYFLCLKGKIQYIGQSVNIISRVSNHSNDANKEFDRIFYFNCPKHCMNDFESTLIRKYQPPLNGNNGNGNKSQERQEEVLNILFTQ